jgi:hypothetical protein
MKATTAIGDKLKLSRSGESWWKMWCCYDRERSRTSQIED